MIDLHSHILPKIDDGSTSIDMSIQMAEMCVADGVTHLACTPHIMPEVYENEASRIYLLVEKLQKILDLKQIPLQLIVGADAHICFDMLQKLQKKDIPTLGKSSYFLFEPPHHLAPPAIVKFAKSIIQAGFKPILTHPERLTWIEKNYNIICELDEIGCIVQLTAHSIIGKFGKRALYWSERMLDEGRVDIIASDAHNVSGRPPGLSKARDIINNRLGDGAGYLMTFDNPRAILDNQSLKPKKRRDLTVLHKNNDGFWGLFSNKSQKT